MPRIVSGVREDFEDPGIAFLAGAEQATRRGKEQRAAAMEQLRLGLQIQKAQADYEEQKAKALADVNARVQMGDVQAQIQQAMEAQAANQPPEQKRLQAYTEMRKTITDPKALAAMDEEFGRYSKEIQTHERRRAAEEGINRAATNGLIPTPDEHMLRLQSGEEPETILAELGKMETARNLASMAMQKNDELMQHAAALVQSAPQGAGRLAAEYELTSYQNNPSALEKPGSAAEMQQRVQMHLLKDQIASQRAQTKEEAAFEKQYRELQATDDDGKDEEAFLMGRLQGKPYKPTAAKLKAEKEKRYPNMPRQGPPTPPGLGGETAKPPGEAILRTVHTFLDQGMDEKALVKALSDSGVPGTPENRAIVKKALQERSRGAPAK